MEKVGHATIVDVSARAGVSVSTVSRVLNNSPRVSPAARASVERAMEELGFVPNMAAKRLKTRRSMTVYCAFPEIDNPYYTGIYEGLVEVLRPRGYEVFLSRVDDPCPFYRAAMERGADGIVLDSLYRDRPPGASLARRAPIVRVNASFRHEDPHSIRVDFRSALLGLFSLLRGYGHRRVGLITFAGRAENERVLALEEARLSLGLEADPALVALEDLHESKYLVGYRGMSALLDRGAAPTAVVCENDLCAVGAMAAARERGLRVPDDISFTGFDDSPAAAFAPLPLTTVRLPTREQGARAGAMLLSLLGGEPVADTVDLGYEIVERESAGPLRA